MTIWNVGVWSSLFTESQQAAFSFGICTLLPTYQVLTPAQAECECQQQQRQSGKTGSRSEGEVGRASQELNLRTLEAFGLGVEEVDFSKLFTCMFNHHSCGFNKYIVKKFPLCLFLFPGEARQ